MSFSEALAVPTSTLAVPINCDIKLFKELQTESLRRETYVFFLDLVTEDNYTKIQQGIDTSWDGDYGLFKGSWSDFSEKRKNFRKEIRLETNEKYSRDYAVTSLKSNGKAYAFASGEINILYARRCAPRVAPDTISCGPGAKGISLQMG